MEYEEQEVYRTLTVPKTLGQISYFEQLQKRCAPNPKKPRHSKAAIVVEILNTVGQHKTYNFEYWLKQVGTTSPQTILAWLKDIEHADPKYPKGAILTNRFKKRRDAIRQENTSRSTTQTAFGFGVCESPEGTQAV